MTACHVFSRFFLLSIPHFGGGTTVHCLHSLPIFFSLLNSYLLKMKKKTKGATRCLLCLVKLSQYGSLIVSSERQKCEVVE
jgi:hypothetical protein